MWTNCALKLNIRSCLEPFVRRRVGEGNTAPIQRHKSSRNIPKAEPHSPAMAQRKDRCASGTSACAEGTARVRRVSIEGNIAVGKSTFARLLQSACPDWEVVAEPVSKWQNIQSGASEGGSECTVSNLLQMMYADPQRWSYTFQTNSCMSRLRTQLHAPAPRLLQAQGGAVQVYERSIYSDRYIFALNSFELGCINATEWAIYQDWHSLLVQEFGQRVALEGIIYLRAPPQTCMQRLKIRARPEEQAVQQDYLDGLDAQHERWLVDKSTTVHFEALRRAPVLQLDASVEFKSDPQVQHDYITKVKEFFSSL
ncbi:deoxyguanosine kinase, mitochondrial [Eucyclogobius newberryi]|uniref:deoxyguanosine kinase, mitochondrial n=1 Tax=Eucyclogobius newberryi TaxID=166745 RepID=UPI003B591179